MSYVVYNPMSTGLEFYKTEHELFKNANLTYSTKIYITRDKWYPSIFPLVPSYRYDSCDFLVESPKGFQIVLDKNKKEMISYVNSGYSVWPLEKAEIL